MEFLIKRARARGEVYRLLAQAFRSPKVESSFAPELREALEALGIYIFKEEVKDLQPVNARSTDLAVEYYKLFYGPAKLLAPPYESMYTEGMIMGESTLEVIKRYEEAGVAISPEFKNLPDHAAAELEFMYYLVSKEVEAWEKGDVEKIFHYVVMQKRFLKEHPNKWIPQFCGQILKNASSEFYKSLAKITQGYIDIESSENEALKEIAHAITLLNLLPNSARQRTC